MESGIRHAGGRPLLKETQDKYKNDPERCSARCCVSTRSTRSIRSAAASPCLLPMPVLLALFFVFANTYRVPRVPFLLAPGSVAPGTRSRSIRILMGLSMFGLSK